MIAAESTQQRRKNLAERLKQLKNLQKNKTEETKSTQNSTSLIQDSLTIQLHKSQSEVNLDSLPLTPTSSSPKDLTFRKSSSFPTFKNLSQMPPLENDFTLPTPCSPRSPGK